MIQYENAAVGEVFLLPKTVLAHLADASREELAVLLYLFGNGGAIEEAETARALKLSPAQTENALCFWRGTGILTRSGTRQNEKAAEPSADESGTVRVISETPYSKRSPVISSGELADAIEQNEDVRSLLNFASQKIGKILTPAEQTKLFALYDVLGMPFDLIMGVIEYCCCEDHKSVNYIERTAAKMFEEDGITNFAAFEEYIGRKEEQKTYAAKVRSIIGCGERAFTPTENKVLEKWQKENIPHELISAAYERTIRAIAKPSLSYMAKIVDSWAAQGIKTVRQLEENKPFFPEKKDSLGADFRLEDFVEKPPTA